MTICGIWSRVIIKIMSFLMSFVTLFYSRESHSQCTRNATELPRVDSMLKKESRPPSPVLQPFSGPNLVSSVLWRLAEVEGKLDTLIAKRLEMPMREEKLLKDATFRVDALESELIATKKVS